MQLLARIDPKKFPKSPELLWDVSAGDQTVEQLKQLALAWASNGPEIQQMMKKTS